MSRPDAERVLGGRYRLVREIARGGMAAVWGAHDTLLDRAVAVKLMHPQHSSDPEFVERFRREARAAARLSHPNIVPIYDVGEDEGTPYIVMELVVGGNLKDRIRAAAPLPNAEIREIGATLASALQYAHGKGLVHRDIKPQNVLVGDDGRPRLTDFGIAQAAMASTGLTRTGAVMGSVQYIAPELVRGKQAQPQSDIYGLGVVLYEMATGRVPFEAETDLAVALAHVEEIPPAPRALNARLAPELERVILHALAKDPESRYPTAAAFGDALRTGEPVAVNGAADVTQRMPTQAVHQPAVAQRRAVAAVAANAKAAQAPFSRHTARPARRGASNAMVGLLIALAAVLLALGVGFYGLATLSREGVTPPDSTPVPTSAPTAPSKPAVVPTRTPVPATATPEPAEPSPTPEPPTPSPVPPSPTPVPPPRPSPTSVPRAVLVPQLRGKTLDQARAALSAAGLTVTVRGVNANVEKDVVFGQTPDAGASLPPGATVEIQVGSGSTAVPDVVNQSREQAVKTLQNNGFRVTQRERRDQRVPSGSAIGTVPAPGAILPRGADIELDISTGR